MAKYRITSIPQSLPKAQLGLFKKKNTAPLWEAQSIPVFPDQESSIEDVMPKRTAEEEANTFAEPFFWSEGKTIPSEDYSYMGISNPLGENPFLKNLYNDSLAGQMGITNPETKMVPRTVKLAEQFIPDYFAPVTETGETLKCTDGKVAYKGQCVTQDALTIILQREQETERFQAKEDFRNKQIAHNKMLDDLYIKNMQIAQEEKKLSQKIKYDDYIKDFFKYQSLNLI